ncbi:MAG TPA: Ada metal-binding domain-containing protein [Ignavibacteriaceae bacterium]|nr:Ada metal-binding domain-containing protein [Ignavibacteriaceae bacterium]
MRKLKLFSFFLLLSIFLSSSVSQQQETKFVGSIKSDKYHYTWCRWAQKIKESNLVTFDSVKEATDAGYIACKVCKPPKEQ